ncbi:MAG TPA: TIGR03756 family integrating conjugative element protein [Woeseiaceae bacterium]|nr:TIGR03756 family integrating conjugative element protein [Woeseiaceae bacterium]
MTKVTSVIAFIGRALARTAAVLPMLLIAVAPLNAQTISTVEILHRTAAAVPGCAHWTPVGVCFWLECSVVGCTVTTSPKVGHYRPDAVVSVFNELGANPWNEARAGFGALQRGTAAALMSRLAGLLVNSAGNRSDGRTAGGEHTNLIFREADVIGHPLSALDALFATGNVICHSDTTPGMPYFQSALDALAWRSDLPESLYPASVIPGRRELGSWPAYTWGPIHPRTGWAVQSDEAKAAALIAQRAADIATRERQPHLYRSMASTASNTGQQIWPPGPLTEADATTGQWQMLSPTAESSCAAFGENDITSATSWGGDRIAEGGDYVWNLWRPYRCCASNGALFLFSIDAVPFP